MKTLMIEDLSKNDEMDRTAMTAVSGGRLPMQIENIIKAVSDYAYGNPVQHSFTGSGVTTQY